MMLNNTVKCTEQYYSLDLCKKHYHRVDKQIRAGHKSLKVHQSDLPDGYKWCSVCETVKKLEEFGARIKSGGGCTPCHREESRDRTRKIRKPTPGHCYLLYDHGSVLPRAKFGRTQNPDNRIDGYLYKYPWLELEFLSGRLRKSTYWEVAMRDDFRENLYTGNGVSEWLEGVHLNTLLLAAEKYAKEFK